MSTPRLWTLADRQLSPNARRALRRTQHTAKTVTLLHITEAVNLPSIWTHGLRLARPRLDHHAKDFRQQGLPPKVLYAWGTKDPRRMVKVAKDVAYWHVWGWRANDVQSAVDQETRAAVVPRGTYRRALRRKHPGLRDTMFCALRFTVPRAHVHATYLHKVLHRTAVQWDAGFDPARNHVEPMFLVVRPVPSDTLRVWATLWTQSHWNPADGWTTRAFCRRAV